MFYLIILTFVLGYLIIALEYPLKINKAATALIIGTLCWMFYILGADEILQLEYNPAWHNFKTSHPDPSSVFRMCQITKNEKNANKINFETSPDVLKFHTANIDVAIAGKNSL